MNRRRLFIVKQKMNIVALIILILSAINAGLIGIFELNALLWLFDGQTVVASRIFNIIVAISGLWCINLILDQRRKKAINHVDSNAGTAETQH